MISKVPLLIFGIHPGDVVVFNHPHHGKMIKLVERLEMSGRSVFVVGRNEDSIDSRTFGPIPSQMVVGKVVWHISRDLQ